MDIQLAWGHMLEEIYHMGHKVDKDGAPIREILWNTFSLDNVMAPYSQFCSGSESQVFLRMIKDGEFDIPEYPLKGEALHDYVQSFDNDDFILLAQDFVYTYPERLRSMPTSLEKPEIDQFEIMKNRLIKNSGSNRAVAVLYNPTIDGSREDIPCLNHLQAFIRDNKLILFCLFRSNDIYGAFPSNMYFIQYIGMRLTEELREYYPTLVFDRLEYTSYSGHVYESDLDAVKEIVG